MAIWQIILFPVTLLIIGLIRQMFILSKKSIPHDLALEFLTKFNEWCNSRAREHSLYNWMLNKSETMQSMLGRIGLINLKLPFENGYHRNCPVILYIIPLIRKELLKGEFVDDFTPNDPIGNSNLDTQRQWVDGCLRRFIGLTEQLIHRERKRLFNPLVLFSGGIAAIMELPLFILSETKIISTSRRAIIAKGRTFSLLSGVIALTTLIGTTMGIVMGWDRFYAIVTGWMK